MATSNKRLPEELRSAIVADYRAGKLKVREIGAKHGVAASTVRKFAEQAGAHQRTPPPKPSPNVLTDKLGAWVWDGKGVARWAPRGSA